MCSGISLWDRPALLAWREGLRVQGHALVFTNGCFDILHVGHVRLLATAASLGSRLLVAVNSDESVRRLKGSGRPVVPLAERAETLAALRCVDRVAAFDEDTPLELISLLNPDVLVKGGDWSPDRVVGRDVVEARGGRVVIIPLVAGRSSTRLVEILRALG
ncbi:MAG: D-glycero-beta-D-manno-heptose 1-phosphate adenylyltransferase [Candidatus Eisenbacteria bacterium]|jgi:D-beta-D-heptose 7-phosphate kinase/D-beta-D-heptose 1-phosphate adenosyltransferase|nr:D-glycero-beta-D-manno-heptose 1-phosphate adenylyltransferase [Candidatus Eisenbacteria bacterium]